MGVWPWGMQHQTGDGMDSEAIWTPGSARLKQDLGQEAVSLAVQGEWLRATEVNKAAQLGLHLTEKLPVQCPPEDQPSNYPEQTALLRKTREFWSLQALR